MSEECHLEEYRTLRREIDSNQQIVSNLFKVNASVTAGIIGFGLSENTAGGAVFLAAYALLIPSILYTASQQEVIAGISQYIRVVLEPKLGLGWERSLYVLRTRGLSPERSRFHRAMVGFYMILALVPVLALAMSPDIPLMSPSFWLAVLLGGFTAFLSRRIRRACDVGFHREYAEAWRAALGLKAEAGDGSDGG